MAFLGRGNAPSFNFNGGDGIRDTSNGDVNYNENDDRYNHGRIYSSGFFHVYYYVPLDNTYVIFEMIATIIIAIALALAVLITYKTSIVDPIASTKRTFLIINAVGVVLLLGAIILSNYFSKDKKTLMKRLIIILVASLVMILSVGIGKIYLDKKYTRETFKEFYAQEYKNEKTKGGERIGFSSSGFEVKDEKTYYIDECVKSYNIFTIRIYTIIGIDLLLIILVIYQIYKVYTIQEKQEKLAKDDVVVYDEEENVKF